MRCLRLTNVEHSKKCTCVGQFFFLSIYNRIIRISQRIGKIFICHSVVIFLMAQTNNFKKLNEQIKNKCIFLSL